MEWTDEHKKLSERLIDTYANAFFAANPTAKFYDKEANRPDAIEQGIYMLNLQIDLIKNDMDLLGVGEVKDKSFYEEVIELMKTLREDGKN
jgi:hypothetical protein